VLAALFIWRNHAIAASVAGILGAALLVMGAAAPEHIGPIHAAWMRLAAMISKVTTPIVMSVIYFAVFTPTGVVRRLLSGRTAIAREAIDGTYWITRAPGTRRGNLKRQF
jgi:hypothetical protein